MPGKGKADPIDVVIGQRLRARRLQMGCNQTELANGIGVTFQQVQKYEKGVNRVSGSKLQLAADFLGVMPGHFFPQVDEAAPANDPCSLLLDAPGGLELAKLYPQLKPDGQQSLLSIVRAMAAPSAGMIAAALQTA